MHGLCYSEYLQVKLNSEQSFQVKMAFMYKVFQRELILLNIINNLPNIREFVLMLIITIVAFLHFPVVLFKFQCLSLLSGFTALHSAVFKNNIQIVTYLVSLGADVNARVSSLFILIKEYSLHT